MYRQVNMSSVSFLSSGGRLAVAIFLIILFTTIPFVASAASFLGQIVPNCGTVQGATELCGFCDFVSLAQNIMNFIIAFSIIVGTLMIVYSGFLYMTAGSNSGQISKAHSVFTTVIIGLVVVLAAWLIVNLIMISFLDGSIINDLGGSWGNLPGC